MNDDWRLRSLGEIADIFDGPHATPARSFAGPLFLNIGNLNRGRLDLSKVEHISEADFERWTRRVLPMAGDIVFSYETRIGDAAIIPAGLRCCLGRRLGLIRVHRNEVDPHFVLYSYLSAPFQATLRQNTIHGSTVDRIQLSEMASFPVRVPPLDTQTKVAHVLRTIDEKIELNCKYAAALEALAHTIFARYAIDSPVFRKRTRAINYVSDGILQIDIGYRASESDLSELGAMPFLRGADLDDSLDFSGAAKLLEQGVANAQDALARSGDIVFAFKRATGKYTIVLVGTFDSPFVYSVQLTYWRSLDPMKLSPTLLYCWMRSEDFDNQLADISGKGDLMQNVTLRNQHELLIPSFEAVPEKISKQLDQLFDRHSLCHAENRDLLRLRDALLGELFRNAAINLPD